MSDTPIFCARCGAAGQRVESYCRSCGEWLPNPAPAGHLPARLRGLSPERRQRRIHLLQLLTALAAAASALITLAVNFGLHPDLLKVPILLCLVIIVWQVIAFLLGRSIQARRSQEADGGGPALPAAQGGAPPALSAADTGDMVRPRSVTENTTALLDSRPAKKGRRE